MNKIDKRIEIVCTTLVHLSSMSQESRDAALVALQKYYEHVQITIINQLSDLTALSDRHPDLVLLGMKYIELDPILGLGDKLWLTDYLEEKQIAYTGSAQNAHMLELDKPLAKQRVLDSGLATSPFYVVTQDPLQIIDAHSMAFPLFIKPTNRGGGMGIDAQSIVHDYDQMQQKIRNIASMFHADSLVEQYLSGREFSVAILKDDIAEGYAVMPIELVAPETAAGDRILSSFVKSSNAEEVSTVLDLVTKQAVSTLAMSVFTALGARDYGRIDIRLDSDGKPNFLEANLLPSLISGYGSFPKACELHLQLDYEPMLLHIVRLGMVRSLAVAR